MKFYNTEQLQETMNLSYKQARALMKHESFPSIRVGSSWLVEEDSLRKWMQETKQIKLDTRKV